LTNQTNFTNRIVFQPKRMLSKIGATKIKYQFKFEIKDLVEVEKVFKELKIEGHTFQISWKRGVKHSDKTELVPLKNDKLEWNNSYDLPTTVYKDKKGFISTKLELKLESVDEKKKKKLISSSDLDLKDVIDEDVEEHVTQHKIPFKVGKKEVFLNMSMISSLNTDNLALSSHMVDDDAGEDELSASLDSESGTKKIGEKKPSFSTFSFI
jgi:hypothetical protein